MNWNRILRSREALVSIILLLLVVIIGFINPTFLQARSLLSILNSSLILVLVAIGEMFVILTRGIDVSVGAIVGISAVILGTVLVEGGALPLAILLAILTGLTAGTINGIGITVFRVPPILMTLGTLGIYRGLMLIITGGSWIETIPQNIKSLASANIFGISAFAIVVFGIVFGVAVLLRRVRQARYFYAVGDNEEGAYLLGVPVKKTVLSAYALAGVFAGLASVVFVAQIGFVPMQTGSGLELRAIAAGVLGGVNLSGGVGTPFAGLVGGLFLTVIDSVLIYLKVPAFWNNAIAGAILLVVVLLDYRIRITLDARQRSERARVRAQTAGPVSVKQSAEKVL
jgi:AI-2 transport system permease protein